MRTGTRSRRSLRERFFLSLPLCSQLYSWDLAANCCLLAWCLTVMCFDSEGTKKKKKKNPTHTSAVFYKLLWMPVYLSTSRSKEAASLWLSFTQQNVHLSASSQISQNEKKLKQCSGVVTADRWMWSTWSVECQGLNPSLFSCWELLTLRKVVKELSLHRQAPALIYVGKISLLLRQCCSLCMLNTFISFKICFSAGRGHILHRHWTLSEQTTCPRTNSWK